MSEISLHLIDEVESRPEDEETWSETEARARIAEAILLGQKSLSLTCGYCKASKMFKKIQTGNSSNTAARWFINHRCKEGETK